MDAIPPKRKSGMPGREGPKGQGRKDQPEDQDQTRVQPDLNPEYAAELEAETTGPRRSRGRSPGDGRCIR